MAKYRKHLAKLLPAWFQRSNVLSHHSQILPAFCFSAENQVFASAFDQIVSVCGLAYQCTKTNESASVLVQRIDTEFRSQQLANNQVTLSHAAITGRQGRNLHYGQAFIGGFDPSCLGEGIHARSQFGSALWLSVSKASTFSTSRDTKPLGTENIAINGSCQVIDKEDKTPKAAEGISESWIVSILPKRVRPFAYLARLDRPIGTWLLAWPCFWSISMAAPAGSFPDLKLLLLFGCGAILLRGAGCTVNDLLDRNIDVKVERTKLRPIASGLLTPFQGLSFLGFQLLLGLGILLQLNEYSQILGASSLLLVGTYPLMKRWTFWPQAYLGLTFNWGALLGWAAVRDSLDLSIVLPLYISGVCWTLVYDTIYAHQDKEDDLKVGVKSTALRFGENTQWWLSGFSIACISSLSLAGYNAALGWPFYLGVIAAGGHLMWQVSTVDIFSRTNCNAK
ncbi:hypothetical protein O6H91_08G101700 [Diphasiastrum complanatum]|nr:hypothetical protein O6H91_08G101700 [Diphasiastrum complanatum]